MARQIKKEYQIIEQGVIPVIVHSNNMGSYTIHTYTSDEDASAVATLEGSIISAEEEEDETQESYHTEEIISIPIENSVEISAEESSEYSHQQLAGSNSKTKTFYCPNCGNCYGAAGSLKLHIRACLRAKEKEETKEERTCNICNKIFNSVAYLKEHLKRHTGEGPKKCPNCYRKFFDQEKYDAHVETHKNEIVLEDEAGPSGVKKIVKEYQCSFCFKDFRVVFESRHCKRRYACDDCREKFSNEEMLRQHKESLDEKKDFHCEKCGRKFVFEGFLQRHIPTCDGAIKRKRDRNF